VVANSINQYFVPDPSSHSVARAELVVEPLVEKVDVFVPTEEIILPKFTEIPPSAIASSGSLGKFH